jgi:type I restriction enzyme S subunit
MGGKYQVYPDYKDSEVCGLGHLPSHWEVMQLKRTVDGCVNGIWGSEPNNDGKDMIVLRVADFDRSKLTVKAEGYTYRKIEDKELTTRRLKRGDLLLEKSGGGEKTLVGQVVLFDEAFEAVTSNFVAKMTPVDRFNSKFLNYVFSRFYSENINYCSIKQNTGIQNLDSSAYLSEKFGFPSKQEQQKIADFLDHETAKIDTLIEKQQKLIKLLKEKRQAVISHAVTKGLNPDAPMKESGVEWLGQIPAHWEVLRIKHLISSLESGVSVNAADIPANKDEYGVLKTSCVYTREFRVSENKTVVKDEYERVKCPVRKGEIIISRMNTPELVGASAIVNVEAPNIFLPDRLWQTVFKNHYEHNTKFISYFMMVKGFRNQISLAAEGASSSMQNIAKEDYLSINIALPPKPEQETIVEFIDQRLRSFSKLEECSITAIELMQERRTALISAAVTGKIDVRNWKGCEE